MSLSKQIRIDELFDEICRRERREIELSDHRPGFIVMTHKRMNLSQMQYYLQFTKNTKKRKKELRKLVGLYRYYFKYVPKLVSNYNKYFYSRNQ